VRSYFVFDLRFLFAGGAFGLVIPSQATTPDGPLLWGVILPPFLSEVLFVGVFQGLMFRIGETTCFRRAGHFQNRVAPAKRVGHAFSGSGSVINWSSTTKHYS